MLQKLYEQTMLSDYIKQMLSKTALPIHKLIFDDDWMYEGCIYQYRDRILLCTQTGRFTGISGTLYEEGFLYANDELEVTDSETEDRMMWVLSKNNGRTELPKKDRYLQPLTVTDDVVRYKLYDVAKFKLLHRIIIPSNDYGNSFYFVSNRRYYDAVTHRYLGEYLRLLNNEKDINLMPLYNCFGGQVAEDFHLALSGSSLEVVEGTTGGYKTYMVPIKFGKEYTIAIDSSFPVRVYPVLYRNGLMRDPVTNQFIHNVFKDSYIQKSGTQFIDPFVYKLDPKQCYETYNNVHINKYSSVHPMERFLYLCIQVPSVNSSTLAVLEGNYTGRAVSMISDISGVYSTQTNNLEFSELTSAHLSLLSTNDGQHHLFADRLVEYLLNNTIDPRDTNTTNVERVQRAVGYRTDYYGIWDKALQYKLYNAYLNLQHTHPYLNFVDILGYVDSDMEKAIRKGYIQIG